MLHYVSEAHFKDFYSSEFFLPLSLFPSLPLFLLYFLSCFFLSAMLGMKIRALLKFAFFLFIREKLD